MDKKECTKCKQIKPLTVENFKIRSTGRVDSWCRDCYRAAARQQYAKDPTPFKKRAYAQRDKVRVELRERIARIRQNGCTLCTEMSVVCLDFHHVGEKDKPIGRYSHIPSFEKELVKCILVCANCHRKIHAGLIYVDESMCLPANAGMV